MPLTTIYMKIKGKKSGILDALDSAMTLLCSKRQNLQLSK